jgi:hypothetical protein
MACASVLPSFSEYVDFMPPPLVRERAIGCDLDSDPTSIHKTNPNLFFTNPYCMQDSSRFLSIRDPEEYSESYSFTGKWTETREETINYEEYERTMDILGISEASIEKIKKNPGSFRGAMKWDFITDYEEEQKQTRQKVKETLMSLPELIRPSPEDLEEYITQILDGR